jgi:surface antigen
LKKFRHCERSPANHDGQNGLPRRVAPRNDGYFVAAVLTLALAACSSGNSNTKYAPASVDSGPLPAPIQCVPFVRELSGINIHGDAYTWWDQAAQQGYQRGQAPALGAVLVLAKSSRLSVGHVAMVRRIDGPRRIEVTHANWGMDEYTRRLVHDSMPVIDVSPNNDWTSVEFFNEQAGVFGQPYEAYGFIYAKGPAPG